MKKTQSTKERTDIGTGFQMSKYFNHESPGSQGNYQRMVYVFAFAKMVYHETSLEELTMVVKHFPGHPDVIRIKQNVENIRSILAYFDFGLYTTFISHLGI